MTEDDSTAEFDELIAPVDDPPAESASTSAPDADADTASADGKSTSSRVRGWGRIFRGNRTLWIVAAIAVGSLVAGLLVGRFIVSPGDAAANASAPEPGLITVPVEFGELSNDVTLRGEVGYADAADVTIDTADVAGPAVVTGQIPKEGSDLAALSIAIEIIGRPVIVLPGELPAYRTLRYGVSGPDVIQLKQALAAVGIDPGDRGSDRYDAATATAVGQLYAAVGYPAPAPPEGAEDAVRAARDGVRFAEQALADARAQLGQAATGPSAVDVRAADNTVASAKRALDAALAAPPDERDELLIADLRDSYELARLQRAQLDAPADTSAQRAGIDAAHAQLEAARTELQRAQENAMTHLPASEVLYLTQLPRRVDAVYAQRGTVLSGVTMTVSGATLRLTGSAAEADAQLLEVGDAATFDLPDGGTHGATITAVEQGERGSGRWTVLFEPEPLTSEQIAELQGRNVRVSVPVGATDGDVLSVPLAALTAGPGGESRVEVVLGDPRDGDRAETRLIVVETGLAAGGYVEVHPVDGELAEGDLVVVGR